MNTEIIIEKRYRVLDEEKVIISATHYGQVSGRDVGWVPENIGEAIEELEISGECSPLDNGYELISTNTINVAAMNNPLKIPTTPAEIEEAIHACESKDAIRHIADEVDRQFMSGETNFPDKFWPIFTSLIADKVAKLDQSADQQ